MKRILLLIIATNLTSCAYRLGSPERHVPGGYHSLAVPMFTNNTQEVGAEAYFTQAMIGEIEKSSLAKVTNKEESQAIIVGEITDIHYDAGAQVSQQSSSGNTTVFPTLPQAAVLTEEYRAIVMAHIKLIRSSDLAVLWQGNFKGEKRYAAPLITKEVLNTADPLYNQSAHMMNVQQVSMDMMSEAFENMTENF